MEHQQPEQDQSGIDIRDVWVLIRRWIWLIVLATFLSGGTAYFISGFVTPVYQAETLLLINADAGGGASQYNALLMSERLAKTYTEVIATDPIINEVISRLELQINSTALEALINVELVQGTPLIQVKVENANPELAAEIADSLASVFIEQNVQSQATKFAEAEEILLIQLTEQQRLLDDTEAELSALEDTEENRINRDRLEQSIMLHQLTYTRLIQSYGELRIKEAQFASNVELVERANIPESPIRPRKLINTALAAIAGMSVSISALFLMNWLDNTIENPSDIRDRFRQPVFGLIAEIEGYQMQPITALHPRSPISEAFRSIRTNIQFVSVDSPIQSLLITSAVPAEGKSTIAANIAVVMAQGGFKVILLDADMRKPSVHRQLGVSNKFGLSNLFMAKKIDLKKYLQKTEVPGLQVITSGPLPPNPSELLSSQKMFSILTELNKQADFVVVDAPSFLAVTDAAVLSAQVNAVLLVVRAGKTVFDSFEIMLTQLKQIGANSLGVVLNRVNYNKSPGLNGYHYYQAGNETKRDKLFKRNKN